MSNVAIRVEGLGKRYRIGERARVRTRGDLLSHAVEAIRSPLRNLRSLRGLTAFDGSAGDDVFWALRDLSFELKVGEVLGVVGKNGAGKSTLLKIISRITEPTCGFAEVTGSVGSLLEVGTGFHPELTGRENIYLNGSILGMTRAYIDRQLAGIVDFAGVGPFLDTPVKRYSSGMQLRLAFAVAAHLQPEILVIDEVLAVGDAEFQRKCLGKMGEIARDGRTVLFVSHNLDAVRSLCPRSILIQDGRLVADGPTGEVIRTYLESSSLQLPGDRIDLDRAPRRGTGEVRIRAVSYSSHDEEVGGHPYPDGPVSFTLEVDSDVRRRVGSVAVTISSLSGASLVHVDSALTGTSIALHPGRNYLRVSIDRLHLNPGRYRVSLTLADPLAAKGPRGAFDSLEDALDIEVVGRSSAPLAARVESFVVCEAGFDTVSGLMDTAGSAGRASFADDRAPAGMEARV